MEEEWWLNNLLTLEQTKNKRLETLTEMYTKINKETSMSQNLLETLLQAPVLYECAIVEDSAKESLNIVAQDFIGSCLEQLQLNMNDIKLPHLLTQALHHTNPALRSLVVNVLLKKLRRLNTFPGQAPIVLNVEVLYYVLDELQQPESQCTVAAIDILSLQLCQRLKDNDMRSKLMQLLKHNETVRCRAYELAVMVARHSPSSLFSVEFMLDAALSELDNDDILLQGSILEILVPLSEQNHGLSYMERRGVFDIICGRVSRLREHPLDSLLVPSIMKFFGKVGVLQPQKIIGSYPYMLRHLFELLRSEDEEILPTAMDTFANLASTIQGRVLLHMDYREGLFLVLQKYSEYTKSLPPPLKIRLLNSLDVIFSLDAPPTNDLSQILKVWYECFADGQQINHILDILHLPFPDLQLAALGLLLTICRYKWGMRAVKYTAGAVEFLMSRNQDLHKDVKYIKWQIVELLSVSDEFTPTETVRMTTFANEGPYFVQSSANVATEPQ